MPENRKPVDEKNENAPISLIWVRAAYHFHTFAYRDPQSAFSSAPGLPVVSPTAVLLGISSTLFNLGKSDEAQAFLKVTHFCQVAVDPPEGVIFFRAFHQLRRYYSPWKGRTERVGFTSIGQGTREHGIVQGKMTLFVGVPEEFADSVKLALRNRDHIGTHDSLCSLIDDVETCSEPENVAYLPPEKWQNRVPEFPNVTILTLSRFKEPLEPTVGKHWWMAGGGDTELVPYLIKGRFYGTSRGKIYRRD